MPDLNDLYFFVQVVDHGGFSPAGRALGTPKSKLSRRIAVLEERLGVRLLQRSTRRFSVTDIGREYYRHCVAMLVQADSAQEAVDRTLSEPQGVVRLSCPPALLDYQVGTMLAQFMAAHPRVDMHWESTNRRVDVIREGLDLALRVRFPPLEDTDLVMRALGESTQRLVASPLLVGASDIASPADLRRLPSLDDGPPHRDHAWVLHSLDGPTETIGHKPRLVTDDRLALRLAALQGVGVVQLPAMMVSHDIRRGHLIDLLPRWAPRPAVIHAVFPSRRGLIPAVRELIGFMAEQFAALDEGPAGSASREDWTALPGSGR